MKLAHVSIRNLKGIDYVEFSVGSLVILAGENGSGKTSILDGIAAVFEGGHDPSLIAQGASKAEVILTLDNDTTITKVITQKGSELSIRTGEGLAVPKPQSFVETLASSFSYDPLGFIYADKKKRAEFLLEAMSIMFEPEEIKASFGHLPIDHPVMGIKRSLTLEELDQLREGHYQERTLLNRTVRDLEGIERKLEQAIGTAEEGDWKEIHSQYESRLAEKRTDVATIGTTLDAHMERLKADIRAKCQKTIDEAKTLEQKELDELANERERIFNVNTVDLHQRIEELAGLAAQAKEKRDAQIRSAETKRNLDEVRFQKKHAFMAASNLTGAIEKLDKLKELKLQEQPIDGVEIREGEIYVGGIPFDQINTQAQYMLAFQIAALRPGKLGLMICDRAEALDPQQWEVFQHAAKQSGFQVIAARVEDSPLEISSDGKLFNDSGPSQAFGDANDQTRRKGRRRKEARTVESQPTVNSE